MEEILNIALNMMKNGSSLEEALLNWPDKANELRPLLQTAALLMSLPKNSVPEPVMQRKYILSPAKHTWLKLFPVSKLAGLSMSLILLASLVAGTSYAAYSSVPGEALFTLKKSSEQIQLKLATTPEKKASIQIEITKKRLTDAQKVLNNPEAKPELEIAAINELVNQTRNTIEEVSAVTKNSPSPDQNQTAVASLEDINKQQQNMLQEIKPENNLPDNAKLAMQAVKENTSKVSEIKKYIEAASNEQTLVKLSSDPNTVVLTGNINSVEKKSFSVENTIFYINDNTEIKNSNLDKKDESILNIKAKVSVIAVRNNDKLIAKQITLISGPAEEEGVVKGTNTETASSTAPTATAKKTESASTDKSNEGFQNPESVPTTSPYTVTGSFIIEDPTPQTAQ